MAYQGSEAYRLDVTERGREHVPSRPSFDVVEGGGADARVRRGVSPSFVAKAKVVVAAMSVFAVLGAARVAITTATVTCLTANRSLEAGIEAAEAANSDLRIERSILSSSSRIDRIATQNYGMVPALSHDVLVLPAASKPADTADADNGAPGEGDAAADSDETSEAPEAAEATSAA